MLAEAAALLRPTFGGRIEVAFQQADDLPAVLADPSQFLAAVLSVGIALRDVMAEGGTLTLRAAASHAAVAIGAHAVCQARADKHQGAPTIELGFVESLVRRSGGGELVLSHSEVGTSVEIGAASRGRLARLIACTPTLAHRKRTRARNRRRANSIARMRTMPLARG